MKELNGQQNVDIGKLQVEVKNFDKRLDNFINNDFKHLRRIVEWVFVLVVLGILVPIVLDIIK